MNNFVQFVMKRGSFLLLFLFLSLSARGQTKTNLELFFQLADSAASGLAQNLINGKNVQIDFVLGKDYQVFQNTLLAHFQDKDIKDRAGKVSVRFAVTDVRIDYGEPERKSLFGPFIVKRTLHFFGKLFNNFCNKRSKRLFLLSQQRISL